MNEDGNSVNIEKKPYHHGDLRKSLIVEGLRLLAERDAESLSLREVARAAGVSATSVYRHFPDKEALMTALALEGLARLGTAQREAAEAVGGGEAGFTETGRAYVRFALANPALFRLIFANPDMDSSALSHEDGAMAFLKENARAAAAEHGGDAEVIVFHAWSCAHGLAMLMLDKQIPADDAIIDRVVGGKW
jgi:AcrR family transcriptional regulator